MEADDIITVYTLHDPNHAEIIRAALHNEGIKCEIDGENQAAMTNILEIGILVRAVDADRARKIIESHEPSESD